MTKHSKRRPAGIAPSAQTRSDLTGADHGQGNTAGTKSRTLGITIKQPLLHSVSAVEHLRMWLLREERSTACCCPPFRVSCAGSCARCTWHQSTSLTDCLAATILGSRRKPTYLPAG